MSLAAGDQPGLTPQQTTRPLLRKAQPYRRVPVTERDVFRSSPADKGRGNVSECVVPPVKRTLATNVNHCGRCGMACAARPGMTVACVAGVCEYRCPAGQTDCAVACVDLQFDVASCGMCGRRCATGMFCVRGVCGTMPPLYHGWTSPIAGCLCTTYNAMAPTNQGGQYPYIMGDSLACRAWELAATVCTTMPTAYFGNDNWQCPMASGFTDPVFGTFCAVPMQYACSTCPAACNATCLYTPLSLRDCMGREASQR